MYMHVEYFITQGNDDYDEFKDKEPDLVDFQKWVIMKVNSILTCMSCNVYLFKNPAIWKAMGDLFGIPSGVLDGIRQDNFNDSGNCFREVFKKWRNSESSKFSWQTILCALASLEEKALARNIVQKLSEQK